MIIIACMYIVAVSEHGRLLSAVCSLYPPMSALIPREGISFSIRGSRYGVYSRLVKGMVSVQAGEFQLSVRCVAPAPRDTRGLAVGGTSFLELVCLCTSHRISFPTYSVMYLMIWMEGLPIVCIWMKHRLSELRYPA
jgi:hypothetical protein